MTAKTNTTTARGGALHPAKGLIGFVVVLAAALLAAATIFFAAEADAQTTIQGLLSGKTIVIDPGHGGSDLGATYTFKDGSRIAEREQNLEVAYKLKTLLEGQGATVFMTRERVDQNPTNTQRANFANSVKADILVSIHMNGSSNPATDYTTTLFGKWQKDKAFAYAIFGDNVNQPKINPPTYGLRTLPAANGMGTIATRTPYSYASGVLLKSNTPATIAETVFITNAQEAEWLKSGRRLPDGTNVSRQQQIAEALETGVVRYLASSTTK